MKKTALLMVAAAAAAFAGDAPLNQIFDKNLGGVESEFVSLAEAMPANAYNFAPAAGEFKGVRTFAMQVKHVAAVNYLLAAGILGEKPPVDTNGEVGPAAFTSKEQIVAFLKDSFKYLHKAMLAVTPENLSQQVPSPFSKNQTTRASLATEAFGHPFDHYGQMVVYARMNGIIPPASR
jgi:hypothetical protein